MAWTSPTTQTTGTVINAATWNRDITDNMTFLGASHDHNGGAGDGATVAGLPSGLILMFDAACPAGWTRVSAWDNTFIRGAAAYGATGGAATHTHAFGTHDHTHSHAAGSFALGASAGTVAMSGVGGDFSTDGHTHAGGALNTDSAAFAAAGAGSSDTANTALPSYINVIFCKKD